MANSQSKRWCFTINNPTPEDYASLPLLEPIISYLVYSDEVGEEGTPHIQGFVVFKTNHRLTAVKRHLPRAHVEAARSSSFVCAEYCKKDGLNIVELGTIPGPVGKTNLYHAFRDWILAQPQRPTDYEVAINFPSIYINSNRAMAFVGVIYPILPVEIGVYRPYQLALATHLDEPADTRTIIFIVDLVGNTGKSWFVEHYYRASPHRVQVLGRGGFDDIAYALDIDKSVFFFDIPRASSEFLSYPILECIKNGYVTSKKYQSTVKQAVYGTARHVVVFMNEMPDTTKLSSDRYNIVMWVNEE